MASHTRLLPSLGVIFWLTACSSGDSSTPSVNTPPSNTQVPPRFVHGVLQAYVKASNPGGANNDCRDAGAVYVFTRSDNTWRQQAYMKASNTHLGDWFGW